MKKEKLPLMIEIDNPLYLNHTRKEIGRVVAAVFVTEENMRALGLETEIVGVYFEASIYPEFINLIEQKKIAGFSPGFSSVRKQKPDGYYEHHNVVYHEISAVEKPACGRTFQSTTGVFLKEGEKKIYLDGEQLVAACRIKRAYPDFKINSNDDMPGHTNKGMELAEFTHHAYSAISHILEKEEVARSGISRYAGPILWWLGNYFLVRELIRKLLKWLFE